MSAIGYPGRNLLLYLRGEKIAGLRTKSVAHVAEPIDETDGEDNGFRYIRPEADSHALEISCAGVTTVANWGVLLDEFYGDTLADFEIRHPDGTVELVDAFLTSLENTGEHAGACTFTAAFRASGEVSNAPPDIEPAGLFVYLEDATYELNESALLIEVWALGGGGGGGGGGSRNGEGSAGGGGGGGGGYAYDTFEPADLTSSVAVTVGEAGLGGAGSFHEETQGWFGQDGTAGGTASFGAFVTAGGGGFGDGGNVEGAGTLNVVTTGGAGGAGNVAAGGDGGDGSDRDVFNGGDPLPGDASVAAGGGGGGGNDVSGHDEDGKDGGDGDTEGNPLRAGGENGGDGQGDDVLWFPGSGGGAGSYNSVSGLGSSGGHAGQYGGGGGGGGAGRGGAVAGDGGNGGPGVVVVAEWDEDLPVPTLSSIPNPESIAAGAGETEITLRGSGFVNYRKSVAYWAEVRLATAFDNSIQLRALVPAEHLTIPGTFPVTVETSGPGGGTSNVLELTVTGTFPVPTLASLDPAAFTFTFLTAPLVLTLTGMNFSPDSVVLYDGTPLPGAMVTYVSSTELQVTFPADYWDAPATVDIAVQNPAPGGGTSGALELTVNEWDGFANIKYADVVRINVTESSSVVPLPVGEFETGDYLIMVPHRRRSYTGVAEAGWTSLADVLKGMTFIGRVVDGTEGTEITVQGGGVSRTTCGRIVVARDTYNALISIESASDFGGNTPDPIDPPSLSPSWGEAKTTWIAAAGVKRNSDVSGYPLPDNNHEAGNTGSLSQFPSTTAICSDQLEQATLDPGVFTFDDFYEDWVGFTLAILPAGP